MDAAQAQSLGDNELCDFLKNAPKYFREGERIKKFQLKNGDYIHCILWNYHFYITGTDIVKILIWRFQHSGRSMGNMKKFEEGVFSDLRNLKPGIDATLENPRSDFLEFLYKNGCIRTQKKQKVFYWYSVPHDALFCDALERDLRRDTTIYAFNNVPKERVSQYPTHHKSSNSLRNKLFGEIFPEHPSKRVDNDIFNIKKALFSDLESDFPEKMVHERLPQETNLKKNAITFDLFDRMANETKFEDLEDLGNMNIIRSKIGKDLKRKFDDFDLDQLEFFKERRTEFKESKCDKAKMPSNESGSAKVRFVGTTSRHKE